MALVRMASYWRSKALMARRVLMVVSWVSMGGGMLDAGYWILDAGGEKAERTEKP
jgi:hypothetical protein